MKQPLWKHVHTLWPAVPLLGTYPTYSVLCPQRTCIRKFMALFITASNWKQSKCPSAAERINKWCFIHTKDYYTAIKKNELLTCNNMDESQDTMLNERSQTQENAYWMIQFIWSSRTRKTGLCLQLSEKWSPFVGGGTRRWCWKCYVFSPGWWFYTHTHTHTCTHTLLSCILQICVLYML